MIYLQLRESLELTFEYSKIAKEFVDTIDLSQDEDPKKANRRPAPRASL